MICLVHRVRKGGWPDEVVNTSVLPWELFMSGLLYVVVASITYALRVLLDAPEVGHVTLCGPATYVATIEIEL